MTGRDPERFASTEAARELRRRGFTTPDFAIPPGERSGSVRCWSQVEIFPALCHRPADEAIRGAILYAAAPKHRAARKLPSPKTLVVDISEAIATLGYLFLGAPVQLDCGKSEDANDDGELNLTDAVALLNHLFLGAPAPPEPFLDCGVDPTEDGLGAEGTDPARGV